MNPNQTQPNTVDKDALNLAHAIALSESSDGGSPNYNAVGKSGEKGAYQWMPGNYEKQASEAGFDPNDFSPATQDKVAYYQVKKLKDQGYQPHEIAAVWNSGGRENYQNHKGVNSHGVAYDTPTYVGKVKQNYQKLANPQGFNPNPYSNPSTKRETSPGQFDLTGTTTSDKKPEDKGLMGQLKGRVNQAGEAIQKSLKGEINPLSGLLQTVGAATGGLGDVVNKAIEQVPGVKKVEELLGQGIGFLAKTKGGQEVVKSIAKFTKEHPELSDNIGAGFNIVTAIPILKGLGVAGKVGLEAGSQALKGVAEKSFISGAQELIASTKAGANFLERNPNVLKDMVDTRLVGDIKGGQYVTKEAIKASEDITSGLNSKVKTILDEPQFAQVSEDGEAIARKAIEGFTDRNGRVIEGLTESGLTPNELIANARKLDPTNKLLWDKFEAGQANLGEINRLRSALDGKVKKVFLGPLGLDAPEIATSKELGAALSGAMRDTVQTIAPDTQTLFKEMTKQFDIQKALGFMDGKKVAPGGVAKFSGHALGIGSAGAVGGLIGGAPGAVVGGMVGEKVAGHIAKKLAGRNVTQGILKRSGQNAIKTSRKVF